MATGPRGYTRLDGVELADSFGQDLIDVIDEARDLIPQLGLRNYEVHLVWTRWSGGYRGDGVQEVVRDILLEPMPKISDLQELSEVVNAIGLDEQGGLSLSQISGRYTENFLLGRDENGNPPEEGMNFFYEVFFITPGDMGQTQSPRRRFYPSSAPSYDAPNFQWKIKLGRVNDDRSQAGEFR